MCLRRRAIALAVRIDGRSREGNAEDLGARRSRRGQVDMLFVDFVVASVHQDAAESSRHCSDRGTII